jgi:hypothetical protein
MDTNLLINQAVTAIVTIVTTIIVVRLSHNQGKLDVTSKLKATFTPKVRAYMSLIFDVGMCAWLAVLLYQLVAETSLPTRPEVFFIVFNTLGVLGFFYLAAKHLGKLLNILDTQRAERDIARLLEHEENQLALLQPTADRLREQFRQLEEVITEESPTPKDKQA